MSFPYFVARRYLRSKRKTGFISIITYVSIAGIAIGVLALILVVSVQNGFEGEVRSRLIGADSHIRVRKYFSETIENPDTVMQIVKKVPGVAGVTKAIYKEAMISSSSRQEATAVKGIDPASVDEVVPIRDKFVLGELDFSPKIIKGKKLPGIVLGRYLADNIMAVNIGDIVSVWAMPEQGGVFTQPRIKQFYVAGLVEYGYYEYDKIFSYMSIPDAQELFDLHGVSRIEVKVNDYENAGDVAKLIRDALHYPFTTLTWFEMHKSLFNWMEIEKWGAFVILSLIIMVAAFNIVSSLVMVVMDKTREIGILKSMGASSKTIMRIFLYEGLLVGVLGTLAGLIVGYGIAFIQIKFHIISLPGDVYLISTLPLKLRWMDFFAITSISMALSLMASVYPAYRASKLLPVEAIRYE